ncbi:helix-turn-helix domain-containing protein [Streptomyces umbrinus]|uniref:helix-turn-helix domain-containing protein n=1 Tax=Streptomyces umbrinus TaxID=67370 RepID=UPI00341ED17A
MTNDSDLLDQAMEQRRIELNMSWKEVAAAAGVSVETITALRKGRTNARNANPLTKRGIERGFQWEAGGFDDALDGRAPTPLGGRTGGASSSAPLIVGAYSREQAQRIIGAALEGLPPEEQLKLLQQMRENLAAQQEQQHKKDGQSPGPDDQHTGHTG